jgi:hypothetical protein
MAGNWDAGIVIHEGHDGGPEELRETADAL